MSERLEQVHKNATGIYSVINEQVDSVDLPIKDYNWLVLEVDQLEKGNERLREALEKIARAGENQFTGIEMMSIAINALLEEGGNEQTVGPENS